MDDNKERLQKVMAACGVASRRKCEEIISSGRVKVNGRWLPNVTGRSDYAGILGRAITDVAISGNVKYRVHLKSRNKWLPFVYGKNYNIHDKEHGYAGNGSIIDAIEIRST